MSEVVPEDRIRGKLGELLPLKYGKSLSAATRDASGSVPVFGSSGIVGRHSSALTTGPTIIVGRKGNVGAVHFSAVPCWPIDTAYFVEPLAGHSAAYYRYLLTSLNLVRLDKSTAIPGLSRDDYNAVEVAVHAPAQQLEIAAELEKQFSRLDEAVANLQRVKANLKRYKASVLNDAVEGRLVESDSPAALVKLGSVANLIDPQPSHRTPPTHPDGVPYIGIGDVLENGKLDFQNSRKVSPTVLEEHRARYTLRIGDFIFGKIGTLGRPTLLMPPFTYTLSANVVLVQADGVRLLPEYALIFMDSPKLLNMISREAKATTQAAYGIKRMRDLEINLPPVEQQRKIVAEVDRHLSIIREVEAEVDANLQRARALRQSTLSSVFSGG